MIIGGGGRGPHGLCDPCARRGGGAGGGRGVGVGPFVGWSVPPGGSPGCDPPVPRWLGAWVGRRRGAGGVPIDRARQAASIRRLEGGIRSNPGKFMSTVHDRRYSRLVRVALVLRVLFPARGNTLSHSGDPPHPAPRPPLLSAICRAICILFEMQFI